MYPFDGFQRFVRYRLGLQIFRKMFWIQLMVLKKQWKLMFLTELQIFTKNLFLQPGLLISTYFYLYSTYKLLISSYFPIKF